MGNWKSYAAPSRQGVRKLVAGLSWKASFDDIPFLEDAQKEHDAFAQALRDEGIEVLYLEQLAAESLTSPEIRDQFIEEYLDEANIRDRQTKVAIRELLHGIKDNQELVEKQWLGFKKLNCQKFLTKLKI